MYFPTTRNIKSTSKKNSNKDWTTSFASKFILKFPTPPVQEKNDFPQRQQWTVSDSTFLGKEKNL